jgi:hypothetical protein
MTIFGGLIVAAHIIGLHIISLTYNQNRPGVA